MNRHKELAIRALRNMQGDDLYRARAAFRNMTLEQMREQHGQSGKTRMQIIDEYEAADREIGEAIAWVESR